MKTTILALSVAALFSTAAHAAFYVDEDSPQVTAAAPQPAPAPAPKAARAEMSLDVPFVAKQGWIAMPGKSALKENLEDIKTAEAITINTFAASHGSTALAKSRAIAVRAWLVSNGVPFSKIVLNDNPGDYSPDRAETATVTIAQNQATDLAAARATAARQSYTRPAPTTIAPAAVLAVYHPAQMAAEPAKTPEAANPDTMNDAMKVRLVQRIIAMSQNKLVKAEDAVTMVAEILKMQDGSTAPAAAPAAESVKLPAPTPVELPRSWVLDNTKTVRENVEAWARTANWSAPVWQSNTPFKIEAAATLNGTFIDVIGQLASAIPSLDFKASKAARTLTVVDAKKL